MKYAKIVNSTVDDLFVPQSGFTIENSLHPDVACLYEAVSDEVDIGWKKHLDGSFTAPLPQSIPVASI
jgi:hypothetical protein